jgi:hypothetical protein
MTHYRRLPRGKQKRGIQISPLTMFNILVSTVISFPEQPKDVLCIARNLEVHWQACAHQTRSGRIEEANMWLLVYQEENKGNLLDILQIQHESKSCATY